ncbi:hypothetical protein HJC22_41315 [Corallococcus exiguus]|nr:hypothetical protein [Corallococcus exiguus]
MLEIPADNTPQKLLADQLTHLFNKLHAPSPKGNPPKELLDDLRWLMRQAAQASTDTDRTDVSAGAREWEKRFDQWRATPEAPVAAAQGLVGPPKTQPVPASPPKPPSRPRPSGTLLELRRTTPHEEQLAILVEHLTREFLRRTEGADGASDLEWQLRHFYERASQVLTDTERASLLEELGQWEKQLKARFPR